MSSRLAATASLPFSASPALAAPQAAPLCAQGVPSTANHSTLCQDANTSAAGAHCKDRYVVQVQEQPSRAEDAPH